MTPDARVAIGSDLGSADENTRWQAVIRLGDHIQDEPNDVWSVVAVWGCSDNADTRMAIATCVLEHLLEHHFDMVFPLVEELARRDSRFADTVSSVWSFGQTELPDNRKRLDALKLALRQNRGAAQQRDEADER